MGNCQAADAAMVVIQHPAGGKVQRIYWSVSAREIMNSNPGHYVALVLTSPVLKSETGGPVKQLKLLRPDNTLLIGQVYRLVSFEDVLKEFAAKKCVKLGKLLKERGVVGLEEKDLAKSRRSSKPTSSSGKMEQHECERLGSTSANNINGSRSSRIGGRRQQQHHGGVGQWKPALKSISEVAT